MKEINEQCVIIHNEKALLRDTDYVVIRATEKGEAIDEARIATALQAAHLQDFVASLPQGMQHGPVLKWRKHGSGVKQHDPGPWVGPDFQLKFPVMGGQLAGDNGKVVHRTARIKMRPAPRGTGQNSRTWAGKSGPAANSISWQLQRLPWLWK